MDDILQRLQRLEDLEAIRALKHHYLNACDRKDVQVITDCFAEGEIWIDFGPIGTFRDREAFIQVYREMACQPQVIDLHHAANPEITLESDNTASACWAIYYFNLDADSGLTRQLGGTYQDRYRKSEGRWQIVETVCRLHSVVAGRSLGEPHEQ